MTRINLGLIGGGNITTTHACAVAAIPGAELVAVYGTNREKIEQLCRQFGGRPYTDFNSFLQHRPLEMLVIGSPSGLHATQGIAAAQSGLHVLVEKPIDISTERADELIRECQKAGVKLGVIFQDRFKQDTCWLRQLIQSGRLGRLLLVDAQVKWYRQPEYYRNSRWRGTWALDGGGALMNQGVHTVDLLLWLLGNLKVIKARTATLLHKIETEDTALALLEFSNGALGTLLATTAAYPGYPRRVEITGSQGTVILQSDSIVKADLLGEPVASAREELADQHPSSSSPVVSDFRGHQLAIEDFIRAIRENGTPRCDGAEGRRSVAVIEEIYRLAGTKTWRRRSKA